MAASEDELPTARSPRGWNFFRWLFGPEPTEPGEGGGAAAPLEGRVGRYRVIGLVGEGGMGRVHLAEDEALRRKVALKVLKSADDVVATALPARGARGGARQPPEPLPDLRSRRARGPAVHRDGAARGRDSLPRACGVGRCPPPRPSTSSSTSSRRSARCTTPASSTAT